MMKDGSAATRILSQEGARVFRRHGWRLRIFMRILYSLLMLFLPLPCNQADCIEELERAAWIL